MNLYLLPAPRRTTYPTIDTLYAYEKELVPGDVLAGRAGRRYAICTIARQDHALYGYTYAVTGQYLDTCERHNLTLYPGNGKQAVYGGPKFDTVLRDANRARKTDADKWHWTEAA